MLSRVYSIIRYALAVVISLITLASCGTHKDNLTYFRDITEMTSEVPLPDLKEIKIAPADELYITVTSPNPVATAHFNLPASNPATTDVLDTYTSPRQLTYIVDAKGDIYMPQIGEIHVAGMTVNQLREDITRRLSRWVEDPSVYVQMINYRVNVLGEVARPGAIRVSKERYTILDAIADAGDLSPYGIREEVLLIREENGVQKRIVLDLTKSDILSSPYYYLQPNDYIYVKPNNVREGIAQYDSYKSYKLSMVSTVVSAASVIASLVIALTVK